MPVRLVEFDFAVPAHCPTYETIGSKQGFYSGSNIANNLYYAQAKTYCDDCGGKLIEPADQAENDAIVTYVEGKGGSIPTAIWIGVTRQNGG